MSPAPEPPSRGASERIDRLYALAPDQFTAERNALAAELRSEGDHESAARVKALRKPSRVAWAVNQVVRAEPDLVDSLLGAGGELRQAHRQAASGRGAAQLRAAADAERTAIEGLMARAAEVLGAPPAPALAEAIRNTLHAASSDDAARELVASGRLVEALRPVGLGPVPGGPPRGGQGRARAAAELVAADAEEKKRLAEARAHERALQKEFEAAERAADRAERSLTRAREAAEAAAARATDARKRLRTARAALREAQKTRERLERPPQRLQDR